MICAGPCLVNNNQREIDNAYKTAEELKRIDPNIWYRAKIWGGGLTPEIYYPGIETQGVFLLKNIKELTGLKVGTEVQCESRLKFISEVCNYIWLAARAMQSYGFLEAVGHHVNTQPTAIKDVIVKRHFGTTEEEAIGIHDICKERHKMRVMLCERGINVFDRTGWEKWIPDFRMMSRLTIIREDIDLMFDPSHAAGNKMLIFPYVKAAKAVGVQHYMLEVYADELATKSDQDQALSIEEFKPIYEYIMKGQ